MHTFNVECRSKLHFSELKSFFFFNLNEITIYYLIEHILKKKLTVVEKFHSHFEPMKFLKVETFPEQVSPFYLLCLSI